MAIQNRAMLIDLTIHQWAAIKHDKSVSAEVEIKHAAKNAGRYNKHLIDKAHLAAIQAAANGVRKFHYSRTLPWADGGQRLLPSDLFMDYRDDLQKHRQAFDAEVRDFIAKYPALVQSARQNLGSMYDPKDYPDASDLRRLFGIDLNIMPVPDGKDFRVDVADEAQEEIRAAINATVTARQEATVKECWVRMREVLERIVEQCTKEKPVIRDSLMENAQGLASILAGLNITDDPVIARAAVALNELVVLPGALRASKASRDIAAQKASEILAWAPS